MRNRSYLEALAVFSLLQAIRLLLPGVNSLVKWELRTLGWSYFTGAVMVLVPVMVMVVTKRDFEESGVTLQRWQHGLDIGLRGYLALLVPQFLLFMALTWGIGYESLGTSLLLSGVVFLFMVFLLWRLRNPSYKEFSSPTVRVVIVALLLCFPLVIAFIFGGISLRLLSTLVWQVVFGGFGEELLYRGYIQSMVNVEHGKPWSFMGVQFGPGLLFSSLLYGLSRGLTTVKPWLGDYSVSWGWGLYAFTLGVFYGFLRERSGGIVASGTTNGLIDAMGETLIRALS
ncbi:MAG: CPBP family intramembrane metalloprotease [Candidatus Bathyarchaeota archaeon]|nr:CPBP family intramembrane metalloprotease [Candidatus Bathyarchaeota archaeon]